MKPKKRMMPSKIRKLKKNPNDWLMRQRPNKWLMRQRLEGLVDEANAK
jgi:hypothetical protein